MSEWRKFKLAECVTLLSGGTPSKVCREYWGGFVPWVSAKDMKSFWIYDTEDRLTDLGAQNASKLVPPGTTLMLIRGMTLHNDVPVCRVQKVSAFNQDVKAVSAKGPLLPELLPHLLVAIKPKLLAAVDAAGHGTGRLQTDTLLNIDVDLPNIETQKKIAELADAIEQEIELNRQINQTLEQMAQAIFKAWFVDFEPVKAKINAKAEGRDPERAAMCSISGKNSVEVDQLPIEQRQQLAATAALFPDELVELKLGLIPKGWTFLPLDSIAVFLNGLALQKFPPESPSEWMPVIKIAQLKKGDTTGADRASAKLNPEYVVDDGDVLFSWSGSLEVDIWTGGKGALNQHLFKVASKQYPKWFYYQWTKEHLANFKAIAAGKAVTMGHIQRKHLTEALCAAPSNDILDGLDTVFTPLLNQLINNRIQARTITKLRDFLLPKLLSGELENLHG